MSRRSGPPTSTTLAPAKTAVHVAALVPAAWLGWQVYEVWRIGSDALGADPVAAIEHRTGLWALRFLLLGLAVTPLRQLSGQAVLLRFRRMLGLYAFFYACLHLTTYLVLDPAATGRRSSRRSPSGRTSPWASPCLAAAGAAGCDLHLGWMRRLGRRWGQLHRLVYAVAILAVLHFWWLVKSDVREPALYAVIVAVLLGWRAARRVSARRTTAVR
ncbi:sulfoxide reductase heme-binding subunit YedZ [Pseudoxanthomonas sp. NC8]|nr:sulfoxide reductase heme-binding subunit YedZ [Pseudoxanthomonas sp. NC8]